MSSRELATGRFTLRDFQAFGALSGDRNPMHVEPLGARRTQAGAVVMHGMHLVLWALDALASTGDAADVGVLSIRFENFVYVGDEVRAWLRSGASETNVLELHAADARVATIAIRTRANAPYPALPNAAGGLHAGATLDTPLEHDLDQLRRLRGSVALASPFEAYRAAFPALCRAVGVELVASLAALSKLSGMVCPGLHSITSSIDVRLCERRSESAGLDFEVTKLSERFRLLTIAVSGDGIAGTMNSFARRPPVSQPPFDALSALVGEREFADAEALVVGGSRGLGEVAAKTIAAGGGKVVVGYAVGEADAERVAEEIRRSGGACTIRRIDVREPLGEQLHGIRASHLYYFATPRFGAQATRSYSHHRFAEFCDYYVRYFYELCRVLERKGPFVAFYPSTEQLAARTSTTTEYAMAKAAGERLCADIARLVPGVCVHAVRLPALLTDQTASVVPATIAPTLETLVPLIRTFARQQVAGERS